MSAVWRTVSIVGLGEVRARSNAESTFDPILVTAQKRVAPLDQTNLLDTLLWAWSASALDARSKML